MESEVCPKRYLRIERENILCFDWVLFKTEYINNKWCILTLSKEEKQYLRETHTDSLRGDLLGDISSPRHIFNPYIYLF